MKKASIRDLRYDFPKIEAWLEAGEEILITKRNKPMGRLVPDEGKKKMPPLPDYEARAKAIFGDRVFSSEEVEEMRAFETGEP